MRSVISILVALLLSITCAASGIYRTQHSAADSCHTGKLSVQVFFKTGSSDIDPDFRGNGKNLSAFSASVANIVSPPIRNKIDSAVLLYSSASPKGAVRLNDSLSLRRALALEKHTRNTGLDSLTFRICSAGEDWDSLVELLRHSGINGWEEAVESITNTPTYTFSNGKITGGRKKAVMDMKGGRLWWEMDEKIFPLLRQATLTVFYSRSSEAFPAEVPADENLEKSKILPLPHSHPAVPPAMPKIGRGSGPVCAIKTNLAYDAASVINLGVEFPLGQKFSIGADIYCPWWRNREKDVTIQIFAADVEGRYWFGNRDRLKPMTGFFAGLYAGAGYFDFQFGKLSNGKGIQSDFFFTGGICAGYAHEICRNLRLEYSVGAGYFLCNFREYTQARETKFGDIKAIGYPWEAKRSSGVLPTKASVSLVWMITSGKGGRK